MLHNTNLSEHEPPESSNPINMVWSEKLLADIHDYHLMIDIVVAAYEEKKGGKLKGENNLEKFNVLKNLSKYNSHFDKYYGQLLMSIGFSQAELLQMSLFDILLFETIFAIHQKNAIELNNIKSLCQRIREELYHRAQNDFKDALNKLNDELKPNVASQDPVSKYSQLYRCFHEMLNNYATKISSESERLAENKPSLQTLQKLTHALNATRMVITHPYNPDMVQKCVEIGSNLGKVSKTKVVGGLLLATAGVLLMMASIGVSLVSYGALAPVSLFGIKLGLSMVFGGVAVGTGVLSLGAAVSGMRLFDNGLKKPISTNTKKIRRTMRHAKERIELMENGVGLPAVSDPELKKSLKTGRI